MAASLFHGAKAEVILPQIGSLDLQSPSPQRTSVFLDEVLDVFVLIHTTCNEETLKESLSRLSITLETHATGTPARRQGADKGPQSDQITELVSRCDVDVKQDPIIAISSSRTILAWITQIHIDRTRITSHLPVLAFTATLTLAPSAASQAQSAGLDSADNEYLVSGVPVASTNLLAALASSPAFVESSRPPYLAETRLHKTPAIRPRSMQPVQQSPTLRTTSAQFKLLPAVMSRLRTVNVGQAPNMAKVLASMEIEVARDIKEAEIGVVTVTLEGGSAVRREVTEESRLPRTLRSGDLLDLVFDMIPSRRDGVDGQDNDDVHSHSAKHRATVFLTAKIFALSNPTRGLNIKSHWRTPIDLSSLAQSQGNASAPSSSLLNLVTLTTSRHTGAAATSTSGSIIHWTLVIANRSPTRMLNLAIIPIVTGAHPTAPRSLASGHASNRTSASALPTSLPTWLYTSTAYHNTPLPISTAAGPGRPTSSVPAITGSTPALLPLTPHIPIGPLPPGTSTTATASFEVLDGRGAGGVEALRVVDLDSMKEGEGRDGRWRWGDVRVEWLPGLWVGEDGEGGQGEANGSGDNATTRLDEMDGGNNGRIDAKDGHGLEQTQLNMRTSMQTV